MKPHPIAELFPMFAEFELDRLAEDIEKNGLKEAVVTYEGKILDGRNRFAACKIARVEARIKEYGGNDPLGFVLSKNLHRRHLSTRERAEIAAKIATMRPGKQKASNEAFTSQRAAAEALKVSRSSVQRAKADLGIARKRKVLKTRGDGNGWSAKELEQDEELSNAFAAVRKVYGEADAKAIQNGIVAMNRNGVVLLAKLPADKMREIQDLVFANRWTPRQALDFVNEAPESLIGKRGVQMLINLCLGTKDKYWSHEFGGFTVTVKGNCNTRKDATASKPTG